MKVYILYKNSYDEIENLGVFSTQEKVERAIEIFSPLEEHGELEWEEFEVDSLEQIFNAALSDYQFYHLTAVKHRSTVFGDEYVNLAGISSLFGDRKEYVVDTGNFWGASVKTKSKKEAIERANKLLEEQRKQNED